MKHILSLIAICGFYFTFLSQEPKSTFKTSAEAKNIKSSKEVHSETETFDPCEYVNTFIGTGGHGHTYPGASAPFGMMQLSPDTRHDGWDGCSGYHYSDSIIYGFSHTHLSGTGVPDYCDLLVIPQMGNAKTTPGYLSKDGYGATFSHKNETAKPGYYSVTFDNGIKTELTVSERAGMHVYTFPKNNQEKKYILLDLDHRDRLILGEFDQINNHTIEGTRISTAWASEQHFYFSLETSVDFETAKLITENGVTKILLTFPDNTSEIRLKVGMSAVDKLGARKNLASEIPAWDFEQLKNDVDQKWNQELSKIKVKSSSKDDLTTFYSALYHAFLNPNIFNDVDGRYRGRDNKIHQLNEGETQYTVFSLWDTYRGAHPLFTIVQQERTADFIKTFQRQFDEGGDLPVWELAGNETECMIGYHSVSVIADAYLKNVPGIDIKPLIQAIVATTNFDEFGKIPFNERGFIGVGDEPESVSKNLEYAYDNFCIYQILTKAQKEGIEFDNSLIDIYLLRSYNFINSFDPQTGFMRGRRDGMWFSPFKPEEVNFNYTEANSWQYSLYAPHALDALAELYGGKKGLEAYLDRLFTTQSELSGRHQVDITGLIGQYAHGNEPSHHMAYLYNYTGNQYKTSEMVDRILKEMYSSQPDGLSGNEDCGQMSAWYVLSAIGFYPVAPGATNYAIGRPIFDQATIQLENDNILNFNYLNNSKENKYILEINHNFQPFTKSAIEHEALMKGGNWEFKMQATVPDKKLKNGLSPLKELPKQFIPVPYFEQENRVFESTLNLSLAQPLMDRMYEIYYTLDGKDPKGKKAIKYERKFTINQSTTVKAVVYQPELKLYGEVISNDFILKEKGVSIELLSEYANQYASEGKTALIDGIRGSEEYRTGDWQGYFATDLKSIVSFEAPRKLTTIGISCLQDTKSWIFPPKEVQFTIHYEDGTSEVKTSKLTEVNPEQLELKKIHEFNVAPSAKKVTSIEITAVNFGKCPEWHLGTGNDTWIFADEIVFE